MLRIRIFDSSAGELKRSTSTKRDGDESAIIRPFVRQRVCAAASPNGRSSDGLRFQHAAKGEGAVRRCECVASRPLSVGAGDHVAAGGSATLHLGGR
jgi:hypothetical protein